MLDLVRSARTGEYARATPDQVSGADCVLSMNFGYQTEGGRITPGPINNRLAREAATYSANLGLPIIAPAEVRAAVVKEDYGIYKDKINLLSLPREPKTTSDMLVLSTEIMRAEGLCKPLYVAHAHHIGRVAAQANMLEIEGYCASEMPAEFDPFSAQWWTRCLQLWLARELPMIGSLKLSNIKTHLK